MGLFDIFSKNEASTYKWNFIESTEALSFVIEQSENKTVVLVKHSTRCGISASVLRKLEAKIAEIEYPDHLFCMIKVIENREVSNEVVSRFGVQHESPQLLVLKNKAVQRHGSHYDVLTIDF
ncbi:MAG: bacillithiol system redox-active protein YtxJ [Flavobacteriaceae bacterium]|jgi:bacillithiol system protein YtxJ|nr:bacillithiol system redox-active protein YtxJ [Flavobacteriaceae bacterium]